MILAVFIGIMAILAFVVGIWFFKEDSKTIGLVMVIISLLTLAGCIIFIIFNMNSESFKRWKKDFNSEYNGGLQRTITVVNNDGTVLKEYKGKMDIQENDGEKIVFIMDGKKYIIYNKSVFTTVFVEEEEEE